MVMAAIISFVILALTPFLVAQENLPDAPHKFMDRQNVVLFSTFAATHALDVYTTHNNLASGGQEYMLPRALVTNDAAFSAYSAAAVAGHVYTCYWLHKRGHHRMERIFNYGSVAFMVGIVSSNYARR